MKLKKTAFVLSLVIAFCALTAFEPSEKKFIKWAEFNVPANALSDAYARDVKAYKNGQSLPMAQLLGLLATKYSGDWSRYRRKDCDAVANAALGGDSDEIDRIKANKYYNYFDEVMHTVLDGFVGGYKIEAPDPNDHSAVIVKENYGLKAFSPIAAGYYYRHCDDFGAARSYGYKRRHLGHDMMGSEGTPIIAVEGGYVEELGWNRYGGWRVGIRSFDRKRYYYYAHLRKDKPFVMTLGRGMTVAAGDCIGYLGRTGYSVKENVNNIKTPHLHFGLQLIFDESQKEGPSEIWVDVYNIVKFLEKNRSAVIKKDGDFVRKYSFVQ